MKKLKFLRIWSIKNEAFMRGELSALNKHQKALRKLKTETDVMIKTLEGAHEINIKLLQEKDENRQKEYEKLCNEKQKEIDKVKATLENIKFHESEGTHHSQELKTMLNDEKINKFRKFDYSDQNMEHHFHMAKKEAQKLNIGN